MALRPRVLDMDANHRAAQFSPADLGWIQEGSPPAKFVIDLRTANDWKLARVWSTPANLRAARLRPNTTRVVLSVDGEATFVIDSEEVALSPGHLLILDGGCSTRVNHSAAWTRFEWHLRSHLLGLPRLRRLQSEAIRITKEDYRILTTMANALIATGSDGKISGDAFRLAAITCLIAAAASSASAGHISLSPGRAYLMLRAEKVIEDRFLEVNFDVEALVRDLSVSKALLFRTFSGAGTTPRRAIEDRRASYAVSLIESIPGKGPSTQQEVAGACGFSSVRQMRTAIARWAERSP